MFKLKLKNYRGFLEEEFDFSKVNILIGENSAGKSSILKFFLALKQSLRSPNNREYNLKLSDIDTDLGNYYETIYKHETDRNLSFSFEFNNNIFLSYLINTLSRNPDSNFKDIDNYEEILSNAIRNFFGVIGTTSTKVNFELSKDLSNHGNITTDFFNPHVGSLILKPNKDSQNQAEQQFYIFGDKPKCHVIFNSIKYNEIFEFTNVAYQKEGFLTLVDTTSLREKIKPLFPTEDEAEKFFWEIGYLIMAQNYVQSILLQMEYVNPILSKSNNRIYLEDDRKNVNRIQNIKDIVDYIDKSPNSERFIKDLSSILIEFGIADGFYLKKEGFTKEFRIIRGSIDNNINDVGFGVSLQLPIFAQALISSYKIHNGAANKNIVGDFLLIEQPEVHLHPHLQAKFIETLLQISNNNIYFIETHSEHIVRMLQIMIKEKTFGIKPEDITIHYLKNEKGNFMKSVHKIDPKTGKLTPNFPKGFYDVSYELAFQLMD